MCGMKTNNKPRIKFPERYITRFEYMSIHILLLELCNKHQRIRQTLFNRGFLYICCPWAMR